MTDQATNAIPRHPAMADGRTTPNGNAQTSAPSTTAYCAACQKIVMLEHPRGKLGVVRCILCGREWPWRRR